MPIVIGIVVALVVIGGVFVLTKQDASAPIASPSTETAEVESDLVVEREPLAESPEELVSTNDFDPVDDQRTFTATASYLTPRRTEHIIELSLTLKDQVVVATEILYDGAAEASTPSNERFEAVYEDEVIGKQLNEINLSRVGGASLTSAAFNEAVADIRAQRS